MTPKNRTLWFLILLVTFLTFATSPALSAGDQWKSDDPSTHQWSMLDLLVARPMGVLGSLVGVGLFITSLPFTISVDVFSKIQHQPSSAIKDAATMFILEPLKFSFTREFPDENM
ncbi:MAG: hypothetical protein N3G78_01070 [Desulfobacterota bacterium]|nr:hypothetical protein [Thermodesulfobacteriota bacterium]